MPHDGIINWFLCDANLFVATHNNYLLAFSSPLLQFTYSCNRNLLVLVTIVPYTAERGVSNFNTSPHCCRGTSLPVCVRVFACLCVFVHVCVHVYWI